MQRVVDRSHQADQLLVDDGNQLLAGIERFEHPLAHRFVGNAIHEIANDRQADVGLEQGLLDQSQAVTHVRFGQFATAPQCADRGSQTFLQ